MSIDDMKISNVQISSRFDVFQTKKIGLSLPKISSTNPVNRVNVRKRC